jgi:cytochrome o ubiquinol oxidase subunit 2
MLRQPAKDSEVDDLCDLIGRDKLHFKFCGNVVGRWSAIIAMVPITAGCGGVLDPEGPIGAGEKLILLNSLGIMLAVVVPTILATLGVAWWFRASNVKALFRPGWVYSGRIELVIWSIPAMVVILVGGIGWVGSHDLDPPKPIPSDVGPIEVQVVSLDWKWLFIYPEQGIASINRLVVPAGAPVHFRLTSATVMNSFFVPQLGSQIYTMAGMTTQLNLMADRPGRYAGLSAQFSGDGFSDMRFNYDAVTREQFDHWIDSVRIGGRRLDLNSYAALAQASTNAPLETYGNVAPNIFGQILRMSSSAKSLPATHDMVGADMKMDQ